MRVSPIGATLVAAGAVLAVALCVFGYIFLPNDVTHRNLQANPRLLSSVNEKAASTSGSSGGGSSTQPATAWYALDKAPKTLDLSITSASTSDNSGMNFLGYSKGDLKITVPTGWTVKVTFANHDAQVPHSVGFVPWNERSGGNQFTPAFAGAVSGQFQQGVTSSSPALHFIFTAKQAGQYAMVCGVPGHAAMGMWDEFDVSDSLTSPTITTPSNTVTLH